MSLKHYKTPFYLSLGLILLYGLLILLLPKETVALHYNFGLQPDRFGSRYELLKMVPVNAAIVTACWYLSNRPHLLNYPVAITEQTKDIAYVRMQLFLGYLSLAVTVVFALIALCSAL